DRQANEIQRGGSGMGSFRRRLMAAGVPLFVLVSLLAARPTAAAPSRQAAQTADPLIARVHRQVLVRFRPGVSGAQMTAALAAAGAMLVRTFVTIPGLQVLELPSAAAASGALASFQARRDVQYAEPNRIVPLDGVGTKGSSPTITTPNA